MQIDAMRVGLVRIGAVAPALVGEIGYHLEKQLDCRIVGTVRELAPDAAFDVQRGQLWSTPLLECLEAMCSADSDRILGITQVDLFIPILTYVFGEALLGRPPAIISLCRLCPTFYGLPADPQLLRTRAATEAAHELGHTCDLVHCGEYHCAMHISRAAEEIDLKGPGFCRRCTGLMKCKRSVAVGDY
jgi:archaemetzincin